MLVITLHEGDYVMIGDNIKVHFDHTRGKDILSLGIEAPKDIEILRGKVYEKGIAKLAAEGDEEARELSKKLKREYNSRKRRSKLRIASQA